MRLLINNSSKIRTNSWYLLLLFFLYAGSHFAQGGFKKKYYPAGSLGSACANVIETPSGDLIALGITVDTINNQQIQRLTLIGTDAQGNQLWKKSYGNANLRYYANIEQGYVDSSGYYQAVVMQGSNIRTIGGLIKFNFQGDTIWQKIYGDIGLIDDFVPSSIAKTTDGGFLLTGMFQNWSPNPYRKLLLLKTDANGNELWRKKISSTANNWQNVIWGYGIIEDKITKRILISGFQYLGTSTSWYSYGSVFCTDSLGNTLWQKALMNSGSDPLGMVIKLSDDCYMAVGSTCTRYDIWGDCKWRKSAVVKFDSVGNIVWSKMYDSEGASGFRQLINLKNNQVLLAGTTDSSVIHNRNGSTAIRLMKIDYDGNMLESRVIGSSQEQIFGTDEIPLSLTRTKDRGYILATQFATAQTTRPFSIIKIDSTFCDTLEAYCRAVELGIHEVQKGEAGFRVFPNPTSAQVTVELNAGAVHTLAVLITDMSGRLVKQIALETADTFQIALNNLEAGVYALQVLADGRSRGWQKVVVQR